MIERAPFVIDTTLRLLNTHVTSVPVDLFKLADELEIELLSLTKQVSDGFPEEFIFQVWGNKDGAASVYAKKNIRRIGYNDRMPEHRVRFTLAEEIMHIILGHCYDSRYIMSGEFFDPAFYAQCEEEVKLAANLLLCHPRLYYGRRRAMTTDVMIRAFNISRSCAYRAESDLFAYERIIRDSREYGVLRFPKFDERDVAPAWAVFRGNNVWPSGGEMERM